MWIQCINNIERNSKEKMSRKKIFFMGLLAHTDSSILKIDLNKGFKIEGISVDEGINFLSFLQNIPYMETLKILNDNFIINDSEKKCYFISNDFECDEDIRHNCITERTNFDVTLIQGYLAPVIRLMRLFKEGNIYMPLQFYYSVDDNKTPRLFTSLFYGNYYNSWELFTLENSEISDLMRFIQSTKLPFKEPFLQLALENFELSYLTPTSNLTFLSLMICMEILFNPQDSEISHRISRNAAVLLGKDFEESKKIFTDIKNLYAKRSNIIHGSMTQKKSKSVNHGDVVKLRNYVRDSIKEINKNGKCKDDLLEFLNLWGYSKIEIEKCNRDIKERK